MHELANSFLDSINDVFQMHRNFGRGDRPKHGGARTETRASEKYVGVEFVAIKGIVSIFVYSPSARVHHVIWKIVKF